MFYSGVGDTDEIWTWQHDQVLYPIRVGKSLFLNTFKFNLPF